MTTRLRTEGTRRLLDAALTAGVHRYIQQSIVMAYPEAATGSGRTTPLDTAPERASVCGPVIAIEAMILDVPTRPPRLVYLARWRVCRTGTFQDRTIAGLRAGTAVVPCDGRSFVSLVHVADMAAAILAACAGAGRVHLQYHRRTFCATAPTWTAWRHAAAPRPRPAISPARRALKGHSAFRHFFQYGSEDS